MSENYDVLPSSSIESISSDGEETSKGDADCSSTSLGSSSSSSTTGDSSSSSLEGSRTSSTISASSSQSRTRFRYYCLLARSVDTPVLSLTFFQMLFKILCVLGVQRFWGVTTSADSNLASMNRFWRSSSKFSKKDFRSSRSSMFFPYSPKRYFYALSSEMTVMSLLPIDHLTNSKLSLSSMFFSFSLSSILW